MPPKQKGHNARGRKKLFRHAVENVSIGIGHTAIGSISLQLAAGVLRSSEHADKEQCAFYVELNHQLLSHSSKDFTRFRWEVLEWCETKSILLLHHREVAEALLERLLDRSSGTFSGHSSTAKADGETVKGSTLEGYEAYLRLTIAFARDLKVKFLPYFEVFQQAVHAGLYDKKGNVIANAERLQYLYSVQAAWCREMLEFWESTQHHRLVRRIIGLYAEHFRDSKEYIRRLSAEILSFLCRLCPKLLPLIVQEACRGVVVDYIDYAKDAVEAQEKEWYEQERKGTMDGAEESSVSSDDDDNEDKGRESEMGQEENVKEDVPLNPFFISDLESSFVHVHEYIRKDFLVFHPIINGLTFFVVHLFRGMQGTLSSSMEGFYVELLHQFRLLREEQTKIQAASFPVSSASVEDSTSTAIASSSRMERMAVEEDQVEEDLALAFPPSLIPVASDHISVVWKETGTLAISQALSMVLIETRKQSMKGIDEERSTDSEDASGGDDAEGHGKGKSTSPTAPGIMDAPSHRLLSVVVQHFQPDVYHLHFLDGLLKASNHFLWRDEREDVLFRTLAHRLKTALKSTSLLVREACEKGASQASTIRDALSFGAAVLEWIVPLCVSPYVTGEMDFGKRRLHRTMDRSVKLQKLFLKVGREAIGFISYVALGLWSPRILLPCSSSWSRTTSRKEEGFCRDSKDVKEWRVRFLQAEAAQTLLVAFVQDVLSKNYCFCLAEERRINDDDSGDRSGAREWNADQKKTEDQGERQGHFSSSLLESSVQRGVPSFLTPLALTLLHSIGMEWWGASLRLLKRSVEGEEDLKTGRNSSSVNRKEEEEVPCGSLCGSRMLHLSFDQMGRTHCATALLSGEAEWWTASRRFLERGMLLLRMVSDTTKHSSSAPLQQILRLKPISASSKSGKDVSSVKRDDTLAPQHSMSFVLKELLFSVASWFSSVQKNAAEGEVDGRKRGRSYVSRSSSLISYVQFAREVCQSASEIFVCMLPLSDVLFSSSIRQTMNAKNDEDLSRWVSLLLQIQKNTVLESVGNMGYLVHAHVSLHVLRIVTSLKTTSGGGRLSISDSSHTSHGRSGVEDEAVIQHHVTVGQQETCIEDHLSQLIQLLCSGFEQAAFHRTEKKESSEWIWKGEEEYVALPVSESERMQLYRAAEMMLEALRIGLFTDSGGKSKKQRSKTSTSHEVEEMNFVLLLPRPLLRSAVRLLKQHLSVEVQRSLSYILLECLAAPLQSLRVSALQLLQVLCDPSLVSDEGYVEGLSSVEEYIFVALLSAERYNPLSHTGNMDGIRRALNPVVSAVEMRTLVSPLSKIIVGRAMLGLYYLKFSEAWSIAQGVLVGLSRSEGYLHTMDSGKTAKGVVKDTISRSSEDPSNSVRSSSEDSFWTEVMKRYGRILTLGEAATSVTGSRKLRSLVEKKSVEEGDEEAGLLDRATHRSVQGERMEQWVVNAVSSYRLYRVTLTDQQRHEKGEMISRAFSSVLYNASRYSVIDIPSADGEVLTWELHWRQVHLSPYSAHPGSTSTSTVSTHSITDAATVSKTFLQTLIGVAKHITKPTDRRLLLMEALLHELSAVYHKEHPSGLPVVLRQIEERVELALQACNCGPSLTLSDSERHRIALEHQKHLNHRAEQVISLSLSFVAEENGRLQRAAIDSLKHLKVEPFYRYHAKLVPFADNMKSLFHFLASFHLEEEVPLSDRESYISTVLLVVLPKLVSKVSKEKKRDQAVLQRRIFSFLQQLPSDEGRTTSENALSSVMIGLLQRLLFSKTQRTSTFPLQQLNFMRTWEKKVTKEEARGTATDRQCCRFISHLHQRLLSSLRLLESLMSSVGVEFACCVELTLTLALQAYLVACKQNISSIIDQEIKKVEKIEEEEVAPQEEKQSTRGLSFRLQSLLRLRQSLQGRMFATIASQVRRSAVLLVATLMEQFPVEAMNTIGRHLQGAIHVQKDTLFGKYMELLFHNSKGASWNKESSSESFGTAGKKEEKTRGVHTAPILRLVRAWLMGGPSLLPLISCFGKEVSGTFQELFAVRDNRFTGEYASSHSFSTSVVSNASVKEVHEALSCITDILRLADEEVQFLGAKHKGKEKQTKKKGSTPTLRSEFITPYFPTIFESLYRLLLKGVEDEQTSVFASSSSSFSSSGARAVMRFPLPLWRELLHTITAIASLTRDVRKSGDVKASSLSMDEMQGKILEIAIRFASAPVCSTDPANLMVALEEMRRLVESVQEISIERHYYPLIRLFNALPFPAARLSLCDTFQVVVQKLPFSSPHHHQSSLVATAQLQAVARAVKCLNSFDEDNTVLERYDFDLRFHTFHSLQQFFSHDGNYKALSRGQKSSQKRTRKESSHPSSIAVQEEVKEEEASELCKKKVSVVEWKASREVRRERDYSGALDTTIPLEQRRSDEGEGKGRREERKCSSEPPLRVLVVEGLAVLAANVTFFLRDGEGTVRTFSRHLLEAMIRYISRIKDNESYKENALERVIRHILLPSLRRGVVARDVMIRGDHMSSFGALGRYFPSRYPSFAALYSPNAEINFFSNVNHVQPKSRLNALSLLRRHAEGIHVRDLLRVFIPFLLSAVKDFAQGKRELQNITEGKAKGYCDAVLMTIASISQKLPWMAYHRVLILLLQNAKSNADLRLPMLQGVVQVLEYFHFLDDGRQLQKSDVTVEKNEDLEVSDEDEEKEKENTKETGKEGEKANEAQNHSGKENKKRTSAVEWYDEGNEGGDEPFRMAEDRTRHYHARIIQALEKDILPPLFEFIYDAKMRRGLGVGQDSLGGQHHTISAIRKEEELKNQSVVKNTLIQLPVALAVTKIVKKLPEERYHEYLNLLLDDVISKLRTKKDKQRQSARRILGVMLQETGPGKLQYVIRKLKAHLVHGYQLHVLGYTVVTLLYQLYEPDHLLLRREDDSRHARRANDGEGSRDVIAEALELMVHPETAEDKNKIKKLRLEGNSSGGASTTKGRKQQGNESEPEGVEERSPQAETKEEEGNLIISIAEDALIKQLIPVSTRFDPTFGVQCLTEIMDELMLIFLDDYLGEIGHQKEQIELMSKMEEVKRNRSLQGFTLLAKHAKAEEVITAFIQHMKWVLTPPSASEAQVNALSGGSAYVRTIVKAEIEKKYTTVGKRGYTADIIFVKKVRELSLSVAKNFLLNPTLDVQQALRTVDGLLQRHNDIREERIRAFESKDGTRRIRGNAYNVIHTSPKHSLKEQLDENFLVAPEPERVDVDFVAHTVLATQQKNKLKVYKGRYAKEIQRASKDFFREDSTTAVVLDTLDEFLLRLLLSMLRKVLGIGHDKGRHSVIELDLLRRYRDKVEETDETAAKHKAAEQTEKQKASTIGGGEERSENEANHDDVDEEEVIEEDTLDPSALQEEEDALDAFAAAARDETERSLQGPPSLEANDGVQKGTVYARGSNRTRSTNSISLFHNLSTAFTVEYRELLQSLLTVVLTTLEGEGSDGVISHALDSVLALVSLRPPLELGSEAGELLKLIVMYFERGGPIKQRALRLCAGILSHQRFTLSLEDAKQMVLLVRAEVLDRTEFLSMSLSLLYAILGKHVELEEIYDLVDLLTELLVHLSGKRVICTRIILCLVRFLTEYKLTMSKFRSHVDLICRNLDYPELSGRLALLDLLNALLIRLPTLVLREEAAVLLLPLAVMASQGTFPLDRERAGGVLQTLIKLAGVDVVAPTVAGWIETSKDYSMRIMGMQTVALCMKIVQDVYMGTIPADQEGEEEEDQNNAGADFQQSVEWCLPFLLEVCRAAPSVSCNGKKTVALKKNGNKQENVKKKKRGWNLIFYALRSLEYITHTAPQRMFPLLAEELIPLLLENLMLHPHQWVRSVCFRVLNEYCYNFVEKKSHYLQDSFPTSSDALCGEHGEVPISSARLLPLVFPPCLAVSQSANTHSKHRGSCHSCSLHLTTLAHHLASGIKRVLTLVGASDMDNEKHQANAAIDHSARSHVIKLVMYLLKALQQCSLALLMAEKMSSSVKALVQKQYDSLHRHITAIAIPILKQKSAVNYVLRCATLSQIFGGYIGMLPNRGSGHNTLPMDSNEATNKREWYTEVSQYLLSPHGANILPFVLQVVAPVLKIAVGARKLSHRLSEVGHQSLKVVQDHLQTRRWYWETRTTSSLGKGTSLSGIRSHKRQREESEGSWEENRSVELSDVLMVLQMIENSCHEATKVKRIRRDIQKNLKRNRSEFERSPKK